MPGDALTAKPVVGLGMGERDLVTAQVVQDKAGQLAVREYLEPGFVRVVGNLQVHGSPLAQANPPGPGYPPGPSEMALICNIRTGRRVRARVGDLQQRVARSPRLQRDHLGRRERGVRGRQADRGDRRAAGQVDPRIAVHDAGHRAAVDELDHLVGRVRGALGESQLHLQVRADAAGAGPSSRTPAEQLLSQAEH